VRVRVYCEIAREERDREGYGRMKTRKDTPD
jgi:hypothetical protein